MIETVSNNPNNSDENVARVLPAMERLVDPDKKVWEPYEQVDATWVKPNGGRVPAFASEGEANAMPGIIFDGDRLAYIGLVRIARKVRGQGRGKPDMQLIAIPDAETGSPKLIYRPLSNAGRELLSNEQELISPASS